MIVLDRVDPEDIALAEGPLELLATLAVEHLDLVENDDELSPLVRVLTGPFARLEAYLLDDYPVVVELHREKIGIIELDKDLAPGEWRYLTEAEIKLKP